MAINKLLCRMWGHHLTLKNETIDFDPYILKIEYYECKHCGKLYESVTDRVGVSETTIENCYSINGRIAG